MLIKAMMFVLIGVSTAAYATITARSRCPVTLVTNHTGKWTNGDHRALNRARNRCVMVYPDAPCLKRFDKLDVMRYTALCGRQIN